MKQHVSKAELCADITNTYHALQSAFNDLDNALREESHLPAWANGSCDPSEDASPSPGDGGILEGKEARAAIRRMVRTIEFEDGQPGNTTHTLAGLIAVSVEAAECVVRLNEAKEAFRQAKLAADDLVVEVCNNREVLPAERQPGMRIRQIPLSHYQVRYRMGLKHLHFIQAWRRLPLAADRPFAPARVSFSWANIDRVNRIPVEQLRLRLEEQGLGVGDMEVLKSLGSIPDGEILAEVKPPHRHLRANVVWVDGPRNYLRKQIVTPLPLFYICEGRHRAPEVVWARKPGRPPARPRRLDARIERTPLLPTLGIHRYLPEYRQRA